MSSKNPLEGDLSDLILKYQLENKGIAFFLFTITPSHKMDCFPVPTLPALDGFIQFSEADANLVPERQFLQEHHLYRVKDGNKNVLIMGVVGNNPEVYNWGEHWLQNLTKIPAYELWAKHAVMIPASEIA